MASTKEYLDFVLEQLSELDEVSSRAMMGEYILYYRGKVFGGIMSIRIRQDKDILQEVLDVSGDIKGITEVEMTLEQQLAFDEIANNNESEKVCKQVF